MLYSYKKVSIFTIVNRKNLFNLPKKSKYELIFPTPYDPIFVFIDPYYKLLINYLTS